MITKFIHVIISFTMLQTSDIRDLTQNTTATATRTSSKQKA